MLSPSTYLASALRLGLGDRVVGPGARPSQPLVLYDFEACPFCRTVREAISMLDLEVDIRPCPKGGARFRPEVEKVVPRVRLPTLLDPGVPDGQVVLQESEVIVRHLFARYGTTPPPLRARLGPLGTWTSGLATAVRLPRGKWARPSRSTDARYQLFSFEASPEARVVREVMTELELPYRLVSAATGSARRAEVPAIPTLREETRGLELVGARAIVAHLEREHAA